MKRDIRVYLDDILDAIASILEYTRRLSFDEFSKDRKTVDAVIRNLEVLGEAAKKIPQNVRRKHSEVPWKEMAGMRDVLIHEYFGVKLDVVWKTVKERLPELRLLIEEILRTMNEE